MKPQEISHHYSGVLLVTDTGRLIGQQRDNKPGIDNPGRIATFGGTVEPNESFQHAAWRELVKEETNLKVSEESFKLFFEDNSWRPLTSEWETRHFYEVMITDEQLGGLVIYEGSGWAEIKGPDDPKLADSWRIVIEAYFKK